MDRNQSISLTVVDTENLKFDDDGRPKRTGTMLSASAHIITAVIGSGVLSLAWAMSQLGWIAGCLAIGVFSVITGFTCSLLADCYRSPDRKRNYTYMEVVRAHLAGRKVQFCGIAQYGNIFGITVGYSITTSISMAAIKRSNCFHRHQTQEGCHTRNNFFIILFGIMQIIFSQIPNVNELSLVSFIAAGMSFTYSIIGLGLSIAKLAGGAHPKTSITGVPIGDDLSAMQKTWNTFSALGNIAFGYSLAIVLVEIQDTLKSYPPENKEMKKACVLGISVSSFFYMLCGVLGYAAFGNAAPGNILTGFGFFEPFWLIDLANVCIVIHLVGAYQVFAQPFFGFVETLCKERWHESTFITEEYPVVLPGCGVFNFNLFRLIWRTLYVILTTLLAMAFPNFNDVLGLLGALSFWPLTVYYPTAMYIKQAEIPTYSCKWILLQILNYICFIVSMVAGIGSITGLIQNIPKMKPFRSVS